MASFIYISRLAAAGVATPQKYVMQSNGGMSTFEAALKIAAPREQTNFAFLAIMRRNHDDCLASFAIVALFGFGGCLRIEIR